MREDIVTRLRRVPEEVPKGGMTVGPNIFYQRCQDAADEIERLRAEVNDLRNTHRAVSALTWEIARENPSHLKAWIDVRLMVTADKEARRG